MTSRERIQAAIRFERPDRLPCSESFWDGTIDAWRQQGMPADTTPEDYFGYDLANIALDASPRFEQLIVETDDQYVVFEDRFGYTAKRLKDSSGTLHFMSHKNTSRDVWERGIRPRMQLLADDPSARVDTKSYFMHFDPYPDWAEAKRRFDLVYKKGRYVLASAYGPWEQMWRHRSMQPLLMDLATEPDWVEDMATVYMDLVLAILQRMLDEGIRPDGFFMVEDLGSNHGMLMSPRMWRDLLKPQVARLGQFLTENRIGFWMHSCGAVQPVIDDLVECGLQVLNPLQVAAKMDVTEVHSRWHGRLASFGNISVSNMLGSEQELKAEIRRKVPLAAQGGFILHSDHSVPPQVDFNRYADMLKLARAVFDATVLGR